jgi:hypothetical protein
LASVLQPASLAVDPRNEAASILYKGRRRTWSYLFPETLTALLSRRLLTLAKAAAFDLPGRRPPFGLEHP